MSLITAFNVNYHGREGESVLHASAVASSLDAAICERFGKQIGDCDFGAEYCAPDPNKPWVDMWASADSYATDALKAAATLLDEYPQFASIVASLREQSDAIFQEFKQEVKEAESWMYEWLAYNTEDLPFDEDEAQVFSEAQERGEDGWDAVRAYEKKSRFAKGWCEKCGDPRHEGYTLCTWHLQHDK